MGWKLGKPTKTEGWDPYHDWSRVILRRALWRSVATQGLESDPFIPVFDARGLAAPPPAVYEPIFVREIKLNPNQDFFALVSLDGHLKYESMEQEIADSRPANTPLEVFLYSDAAWNRERPFYEVLHVGSPVNLQTGKKPRTIELVPVERSVGPVALGIVDDGICYLNRRFAGAKIPGFSHDTRFLAFWHQSLATDSGAGSKVDVGSFLDFDDLDKLLAKPAIESELYRAENRLTHPDGLTHTNQQAASHGTHVLDLAAGGAELAEVPLIGAQLPPDAVDDTAGQRLETHLLQALRWMVRVARINKIPNLVVNASLGVLAGPKDGRKFMEQQIKREIELAAMPVAAGIAVNLEVVLPFGSEYDTRQVAELLPKSNDDRSVELRLQRGDRAASYVEVRPQAREDTEYDPELAGISIVITTPDGEDLDPIQPADGHHVSIELNGDEVARVYRAASRPGAIDGSAVRSYLAIAFAPTEPFAPETGAVPLNEQWKTTAPAGRWQIKLCSTLTDPGKVSVQVQRGDSAVGYKVAGRQAFLDAGPGINWNEEDRDHTGLGSGGVTHEGTNSAYATSGAAKLHPVGSALVRPGATDPVATPARYASQGADWSIEAPIGAAVTETGTIGCGLTASGSYSGGAGRFSGSSMAAPTHARDRVLRKLKKQELDSVRNVIDTARLGATTITANPAIRKRGP